MKPNGLSPKCKYGQFDVPVARMPIEPCVVRGSEPHNLPEADFSLQGTTLPCQGPVTPCGYIGLEELQAAPRLIRGKVMAPVGAWG